jgi:hypothetical protein
MSPLPRLTIALLGTTAVLAGCGGEPATVTDQDAVLRLKLDEYRIDPQNIRVQATAVPMRIKIVATNVGRLTHTVKVEPLTDDTEREPDDSVLVEEDVPAVPVQGLTDNVPPGQIGRSEDICVYPGEYRLADTIGNHENLGQYGSLTISPPEGYQAPAGPTPPPAPGPCAAGAG